MHTELVRLTKILPALTRGLNGKRNSFGSLLLLRSSWSLTGAKTTAILKHQDTIRQMSPVMHQVASFRIKNGSVRSDYKNLRLHLYKPLWKLVKLLREQPGVKTRKCGVFFTVITFINCDKCILFHLRCFPAK